MFLEQSRSVCLSLGLLQGKVLKIGNNYAGYLFVPIFKTFNCLLLFSRHTIFKVRGNGL